MPVRLLPAIDKARERVAGIEIRRIQLDGFVRARRRARREAEQPGDQGARNLDVRFGVAASASGVVTTLLSRSPSPSSVARLINSVVNDPIEP